MSQRSKALAERLEQGGRALASFASALTDLECQTRTPRDGRRLRVVVRIRNAVIITIGLAGVTACGSESYGITPPGTGGGPVGSVVVGSGVQFVSGHNGSMNPAVDTIPAGTTVTWTWSGTLPHTVRSVGSTSFASSGTFTGNGTYAVTFIAPGTYTYDCAVHGQAMTGRVVVR